MKIDRLLLLFLFLHGVLQSKSLIKSCKELEQLADQADIYITQLNKTTTFDINQFIDQFHLVEKISQLSCQVLGDRCLTMIDLRGTKHAFKNHIKILRPKRKKIHQKCVDESVCISHTIARESLSHASKAARQAAKLVAKAQQKLQA